ncbi:hypothetical protein EVAR_48329_1 [Eumeta japonica]|uniref:Uncharacterized protein n=1 Tax=Eumeta variegata TaxID=151549 RepID=A0A4C1YLY4_EUMVA|nr:hypothetical protein EVAR_48329_1 [Eumeta japonica]
MVIRPDDMTLDSSSLYKPSLNTGSWPKDRVVKMILDGRSPAKKLALLADWTSAVSAEGTSITDTKRLTGPQEVTPGSVRLSIMLRRGAPAAARARATYELRRGPAAARATPPSGNGTCCLLLRLKSGRVAGAIGSNSASKEPRYVAGVRKRPR